MDSVSPPRWERHLAWCTQLLQWSLPGFWVQFRNRDEELSSLNVKLCQSPQFVKILVVGTFSYAVYMHIPSVVVSLFFPRSRCRCRRFRWFGSSRLRTHLSSRWSWPMCCSRTLPLAVVLPPMRSLLMQRLALRAEERVAGRFVSRSLPFDCGRIPTRVFAIVASVFPPTVSWAEKSRRPQHSESPRVRWSGWSVPGCWGSSARGSAARRCGGPC